MSYAKDEGKNQAVLARIPHRLPVFYPTVKVAGATYQDSDTRRIPHDDRRTASASPPTASSPSSPDQHGDYYGVQGVNWDDPPILKNPSEIAQDQAAAPTSSIYEGGKARTRRLQARRRLLLGLQHAHCAS